MQKIRMILSTLPNLEPFLPELFLIFSNFITLGSGLFSKKNIFQQAFYVSQFSVLFAAFLIFLQPQETQITFNGLFINNSFTTLIKLILLIGTAGVLSLIRSSLTEDLCKSEFFSLILFSLVGMLCMVSAQDLITLFIGIEIQSLSLYILIAMQRKNIKASEAALKYFILGALSTGILLYGCSYIYGYLGTTHFEALRKVFHNTNIFGSNSISPFLGFILIIAALGFKLSAAPFHMWAPDIYEGSPIALTTFLATVPKIAAFAVVMRVLAEPFLGFTSLGYWLLLSLSILSMLIGSIAALKQENIKRLLAYSSIGHIGFALIGVLVGTQRGMQSSLIYLIFYILTTLGFFGGLIYLHAKGKEIEKLSDLNAIGRQHPTIAFMLGFILFSMAGIPPLPGFIPKLFILQTSIAQDAYILSIIAVLYSVISAAYYLIIMKAIFFDKPIQASFYPPIYKKTDVSSIITLSGLNLLLIAFFIWPDPLLKWTNQAAIALNSSFIKK